MSEQVVKRYIVPKDMAWDVETHSKAMPHEQLMVMATDYEALHAEAEALQQRLTTEQGNAAYWKEQYQALRNDYQRTVSEKVGLRTELEAARGLIGQLHAGLRSLKESVFPDDPHGTASMHEFIDALLSLTATPAPEVPDHLRDSAKMAEQGERQEAQVMGRVHHNPDHPEPVRAVLNSIGRQLPDNAPLYTTPPHPHFYLPT